MRRAVGLLMFSIAVAITASCQVVTTLVSFNGVNGTYPVAALVQGSDGNFYGTTVGGGLYDAGTVFKFTLDGTLTTLHSFNSAEGSGPEAALIQAKDGDFYGTTSFGGDNSGGTVFKMTMDGELATLYSFDLTHGYLPRASLVQASNGDFYGLAEAGGASSGGTVFQLTSGGTLTTLYDFCSLDHCSDGVFPFGWLVIGSGGDFYGTTHGGATNAGTVFKITLDGALTTLHSFNYTDGSSPYAGLAQGTDGSFYGTTAYSGPSDAGTVFKITPEGALTTLHYFCTEQSCPDGAVPFAGLVQGTEGNFYGAAYTGGAKRNGTIYKITPQGALATLYTFSGPDGANPQGRLVQGADGYFYGTTETGGANNRGTIFRLVAYAPVSVTKAGSGTVTSGDEHIYCGSVCSYTYDGGTQVGLTEIPAPGYTFAGWSGCNNVQNGVCLVQMSSAKTVTATFTTSNVGLTSLVLNPSSVKGGNISLATITLNAPAPDGGLGIAITTDHPEAVHPPSLVMVPGGRTSFAFAVRTSVVRATTKANVTASADASQVSATITVTPTYQSLR